MYFIKNQCSTNIYLWKQLKILFLNASTIGISDGSIQIQNVWGLDSDKYSNSLDLREEYSNTTAGIREAASACDFRVFSIFITQIV